MKIIVDGYNMIRRVSALGRSERRGLASGRDALLMALEEYGAQNGYEIVAVFDGGGMSGPVRRELPEEERFAGIDVVFSGHGTSADEAIVELLQRDREEGASFCEITLVITDDLAIADEARAHGGLVRSPLHLWEAMEGRAALSY